MPQSYPDFFHSKPESRVPAPITTLPCSAITDTVDPTREIRALIEQLQQTARDARTQTSILQREKEDLGNQLENALLQIDQLRANEQQFRAQFIEISSLLRERDAAVQEMERMRRAGTDLQRQLEAANRERSDANRQREGQARRQAEDAKALQQALAQLAESQKQILTLRQARDAATARNLELKREISHSGDEIAELGYQQEAAQKNQRLSHDELTQLRRQLGAVTADRDATVSQVRDLNDQLDETRKKLLDLTAQNSAALDADSQHMAALDEARTQVTSLAAERDAARTRAQDLSGEADALRLDLDNLRQQLETANANAGDLDEARRQIATLEATRMAEAARQAELATEAAAQEQRLAELMQELAVAQQRRDEALAVLEAEQRQFEQTALDRDQRQAAEAERAIDHEAQIATLRGQVANLEENLAAANRRVIELSNAQQETRQLATRFEKQRVATIELGARLEAAQREIMELSANLAEARLAARFANTRAAKEAAAAIKSGQPLMATSADIASHESQANGDHSGQTQEASLECDLQEAFTEKEAKSALAAMKHCFQAYQKSSSDVSLLNELYSHIYGFSERARVSGYVALHRLSAPFASLVQELYEMPEALNPSVTRTIEQTIDFLITLMKDRNVSRIKDPATAHVYVVDDDRGNCEAIRRTMERTMLQTTYALEPGEALAEIAVSHFDVIFLDVNLPGMDGFDLCAHIREIPGYAKTPVVFLTGMATLENRVQSSLSGGNDFIGKPFNLHELTVKALTLIVKTELHMD